MEKLLTAKQLSDILEIKVATVYDWVSRKEIPYVKIGRLIRFKKAEVFRWVDSHTIRPNPSSGRKKQSGRAGILQKEFPLT